MFHRINKPSNVSDNNGEACKYAHLHVASKLRLNLMLAAAIDFSIRGRISRLSCRQRNTILMMSQRNAANCKMDSG